MLLASELQNSRIVLRPVSLVTVCKFDMNLNKCIYYVLMIFVFMLIMFDYAYFVGMFEVRSCISRLQGAQRPLMPYYY